jgi:hypothetical protein
MSSVDVVNVGKSYGGVQAILGAFVSIATGEWSMRGAPKVRRAGWSDSQCATN